MGVQGPPRDVGPCFVYFNGTSVGETHGGVQFRYALQSTEVHEDSKGVEPVDDILIGATCEVDVEMTRMAIARLAEVTPGASGSGTAGNIMLVKQVVGQSQYNNARKLVLKPIVNGVASADTTEWITVFRAAPTPAYELPYTVTDQRTYKVTFKAYRVLAGANAGKLWKMGA